MNADSLDDRNTYVPFRDLDGRLLHPDIRRQIILELKATPFDGARAEKFVAEKMKQLQEAKRAAQNDPETKSSEGP